MFEANIQNLSDEQLAQLSIKSPEIYAVLVERYKDSLLNFIFFHFIQDKEQAEDIVQEALIKAYISLDKFDASKKWKTWLFKIAINSAYSLLRKPKSEDLDDYVDVLVSDNSPENFTDQQLQKEKLEKVLSDMEPEYKLILDLFYKNDLSYEEISNVLNLQINTVKTRLHRAKHQLAINFQKMYD